MVTYTERPEASPASRREITKHLESAAWGLFFLWVGYALLTDLSIGIGLMGVGIITLLAQVTRKVFALPVEGFWVLAGLGFLAGGVWNLYALEIPLAPMLFLGLGIVLLIGAFLRWEGKGEVD